MCGWKKLALNGKMKIVLEKIYKGRDELFGSGRDISFGTMVENFYALNQI
jgi:hypothetical protein